MTNTEWIDVQVIRPGSNSYLVNIHNISMIHYESNLVWLVGRTEPLHITDQSMKELYETVLKNMY